jgi:hypothetical protein
MKNNMRHTYTQITNPLLAGLFTTHHSTGSTGGHVDEESLVTDYPLASHASHTSHV